MNANGFLLCAFCAQLSIWAGAVHAMEVIKTGMASPQATADYANVERLRQRALRNAMELALMEVRGMELSSERGVMDYSRESLQGRDGNASQSWKQRTAVHTNTKTRLGGSVKVLDVIREWREGERYLVRVKLEVSEDESAEKANLGSLWRRAGKPEIALKVRVSHNDGSWWPEASFRNYLRQQLNGNGVETRLKKGGRYTIKVWLAQENSYLGEYDTWKTLCEASFAIEDTQASRSRKVRRIRGGPAAGFSLKEAQNNCLEKISQPFSQMLLEDLAVLLNDEWLNGRDFLVRITGMPANQAGRAKQVIGDTLSVSTLETRSFAENTLKLDLAYKGAPLELAETLVLGMDAAGMNIEFRQLQGNQLDFVWRGMDD